MITLLTLFVIFRVYRFAADDAASHESALEREKKRFAEAIAAQRRDFQSAMEEQRREYDFIFL